MQCTKCEMRNQRGSDAARVEMQAQYGNGTRAKTSHATKYLVGNDSENERGGGIEHVVYTAHVQEHATLELWGKRTTT